MDGTSDSKNQSYTDGNVKFDMIGDGSRIFVEVLIIGAGPAGSVAAALLHRQGRQVLVLEREQFPRFSIGESLLPQSMEYLEQAGMLRAVKEGGFQLKNGAAFGRGEKYTEFDFSDKHSAGWSTTYQVPRARFDHLLVLEAERQGAEVRYRYEVVAVDISGQCPRVTVKDLDGKICLVEAEIPPRRQRLWPRIAAFAAIGNPVELSRARGDIHAHRR